LWTANNEALFVVRLLPTIEALIQQAKAMDLLDDDLAK
jgi:hypothetical protein